MITVRRDAHRHHERRRGRYTWRTFDPADREDVLGPGFGILQSFNEHILPPSTVMPPGPPGDAEILTYVQQGGLAQEDSLGRSGVLQAGECQRMTVGRGVRHSATNPSRSDDARVFQVWLRASEAGLLQSYEQKRFSAAERRGNLCVVASPDGQRNSLRIRPDALMYSMILDPGRHIVHELMGGRLAWLHVVSGEIMLAETVLTAGDGAGVEAERTVSLTAREQSELLLVDVQRYAAGEVLSPSAQRRSRP